MGGIAALIAIPRLRLMPDMLTEWFISPGRIVAGKCYRIAAA